MRASTDRGVDNSLLDYVEADWQATIEIIPGATKCQRLTFNIINVPVEAPLALDTVRQALRSTGQHPPTDAQVGVFLRQAALHYCEAGRGTNFAVMAAWATAIAMRNGG